MKWYENNTNNVYGIVISSRIRLARNLLNYCFPNRLNYEQSEAVVNDVKKTLDQTKLIDCVIDMNSISKIDQIAMMERHIISPGFINNPLAHSIFTSEDERLSIMVNEEDHIRIQAMQAGMNLDKAYQEANVVDNVLEKALTYATSHEFGYLTACPTNLGTGMRASYMLHVPALESTGQLSLILEAIGKFGLTVRGIYGEGSKAEGSVFQISNQVTIGINEAEIIDNVTSITKQIIEQEIEIRGKLLVEKKLELEDKIYRSYGVLTNARMMKSGEAMALLSDIKLGIELGLLKTETGQVINIFDFMTCIQPANLLKLRTKDDLSQEQRDILRATYIRENLPKLS